VDKKNKKEDWQWPDYEDVVFVPDEQVRALEKAYFKMWEAQQEFKKVAEGMKELRIEN
jgi:hypothetical protein